MGLRRMVFAGTLGHQLVAWYDEPEGTPRGRAVFAHCFTCTKDLKAARHVSRGLTERGIGVLRFDFTGVGESGGDFADTTFSSNVGDIVRASRAFEAEEGPVELLVGHSLGGTAALVAAGSLPRCRAVATIASPSSTTHLLRSLDPLREIIASQGAVTRSFGGQPVRIGMALLNDLTQHAVLEAVASLDKALLVCHAPRDTMVPVTEAHDIFAAAPHPKSFLSLGRADHLLTDAADAVYVGAMIATWVSPYFDG